MVGSSSISGFFQPYASNLLNKLWNCDSHKECMGISGDMKKVINMNQDVTMKTHHPLGSYMYEWLHWEGLYHKTHFVILLL